MEFKMTKQFAIKGRERLVKPLSKLGLSMWLRPQGGSLWGAKDEVLTLVPGQSK